TAHRADEALAELPNLHRAQLLDGLNYAKLELAVILQALDEARNGDALTRIWNALPRGQKRSPDVLEAYLDRAHAYGIDDPAALIEAHLKTDWSEPLVRLYGRLDQPAPGRRLKFAESWLAAHADSIGLNVTLSRLYAREGLDAKAEEHLGRVLGQANDADA